jgi:hypothetical protein
MERLESQIAWPKSKVVDNVTNKNKTPETSMKTVYNTQSGFIHHH